MEIKDKKEKPTLIFSQNASELYMGNSLTFRKMTKHILTLVFSIYLLIIIWQVKEIPMNEEQIILFVWKASIYSVIVMMFKKSVKLLHMLNNEFYIIALILLVSISYGSVLTFYTTTIKVNEYKDLYFITVWTLPIAFSNVFWYPLMAFFERKTKPFFSVVLIFQTFGSLALSIASWMVHVQMTTIILTGESYDIRNPFIISTLMTGITFFIIGSGIYTYTFFTYKSFLIDPFATKTSSYASALVSLIPVAIWFTFSNAQFKNTTHSWIYTLIIICIGGLTLYLGLSSKNQINSSKIYFTINSLVIALTWILSFIFLSQYKGYMDADYTRSLALIITALAAGLTYWRSSPSPNAFSSFFYQIMIGFLVLIILFLWAISKFNILPIDLPFNINELLSAIIMVFPILTFFFSFVSWFVILGRMNKNLRRMTRAKKNEQREIEKMQNNKVLKGSA